METESERLLARIRVLDTALANVHSQSDDERGEIERAIKRVRADDINRLRELGHPYNEDGAV
jgi:hypothetical protein